VGIAVGMLGLGEAGSLIAADLRVAGARVRGYDPRPETDPDAASAPEAVAAADVVLSLTTAACAREAARSVLGALRPGMVYADANTAGAGLKRELAALIEPTGAAFADVALMAPVPGKGLGTPSLASGGGADAFVAAFAPLGMPVSTIGAEPGDAAQRKLLRSVLWKGLAAAILEALAAARAAGREEWMEEQVVALLEGADGALMTRMVDGSKLHAARRVEEMEAAADQLRELGVTPRVAEASAGWLRELRDEVTVDG
jgi:3-hydroxyisobutyrate dehydrogenase-like beta-hydroxyacid dehydrogenase